MTKIPLEWYVQFPPSPSPSLSHILACIDQTILWHAIANPDAAMFELILLNTANPNIQLPDANTILHRMAEKNSHHTCAVLLSKSRVLPDLTYNKKGFNPFHIGARNGSKEVLELLCKHYPKEIDSLDKDSGWTPLFLACKFGKYECARVLVEAGANVNSKSTDRQATPLMKAAESGSVDTVEYLLAKGADAWAKDIDGKTAKDIATAKPKETHDDVVIALYAFTE